MGWNCCEKEGPEFISSGLFLSFGQDIRNNLKLESANKTPVQIFKLIPLRKPVFT